SYLHRVRGRCEHLRGVQPHPLPPGPALSRQPAAIGIPHETGLNPPAALVPQARRARPSRYQTLTLQTLQVGSSYARAQALAPGRWSAAGGALRPATMKATDRSRVLSSRRTTGLPWMVKPSNGPTSMAATPVEAKLIRKASSALESAGSRSASSPNKRVYVSAWVLTAILRSSGEPPLTTRAAIRGIRVAPP